MRIQTDAQATAECVVEHTISWAIASNQDYSCRHRRRVSNTVARRHKQVAELGDENETVMCNKYDMRKEASTKPQTLKAC